MGFSPPINHNKLWANPPLQIREEIMNDLIIYNTDDGKSHVALLVVENEAWLTQNQLAELFDTSVQNIVRYTRNIL